MYAYLGRFTIKARLIALIGLLSVLLAAVGGLGLVHLQETNKGLQTVYNDRVVPLKQLKVVADMYAVNIVDTAHKTRNGNFTYDEGLKNVEEAETKIAENWKAYTSTFLVPDEKRLVAEAEPLLQAANNSIQKLKDAMRRKDHQSIADYTIKEMYPLIDPISGKVSEVVDLQLRVAKEEYDAASARYDAAVALSFAVIALGIGFGCTFGFFLLQSVIKPMDRAYGYFQRMAEGHLDVDIVVDSKDEVAKILQAALAMQTKLSSDLGAMTQVLAESTRVRNALDGTSANVMIADNDGNIVYLNRAVTAMLTEVQSELRTVLPSFKVDGLLGQNFDVFHRNPAHQRNLLKNLNDIYRTRIKVGGLVFDLIAAPVKNESNERLGSVVEWINVTEQVKAEAQIQSMIAGASEGRLDQRIQTEGFREGFLKTLAAGVNSMFDAIVAPVHATKGAVQALAKGDLTHKVNGDFQGEFAELRDAVNECVDNLQNMVSQILESADSITTSSSEIAQGNHDLSQRTEEQASSLEQTASSMEELTSTVKQNADNARQANQLARGARDQAESGGAVVGTAISAMGEINRASNKIADIIGVIDEIAFQTNLLALNAAVEAARAGEQGRGFAVVASEVRNLAQRSAGAAKEIKALIKDSVDRVEEGSRLVNESGSTLETIVSSVKKVSDIIAEIAAASEEQSAGIEQVNKAITHMDQAVQQNAALVEEAAAASESMDEQARSMTRLMEFFRTGRGKDGAAALPKVERRSGSRPWSKPGSAGKAPAAAKPTVAVPVAKAKVAAGGADVNEWEDF